MSSASYTYKFEYDWKSTIVVSGSGGLLANPYNLSGKYDQSKADAGIADMIRVMNAQAQQQFAAKIVAGNPTHWFKVDSVTTTDKQTAWRDHPTPVAIGITVNNGFEIDITGHSIITFETDVADAKAEMSPQSLWELLVSFVGFIYNVWEANPTLFLTIIGTVAILSVLALVLFSPTLSNLSAGIQNFLGSTAGQIGTGIAVAVFSVAALAGVYYYFTRKRKPKGRR